MIPYTNGFRENIEFLLRLPWQGGTRWCGRRSADRIVASEGDNTNSKNWKHHLNCSSSQRGILKQSWRKVDYSSSLLSDDDDPSSFPHPLFTHFWAFMLYLTLYSSFGYHFIGRVGHGVESYSYSCDTQYTVHQIQHSAPLCYLWLCQIWFFLCLVVLSILINVFCLFSFILLSLPAIITIKDTMRIHQAISLTPSQMKYRDISYRCKSKRGVFCSSEQPPTCGKTADNHRRPEMIELLHKLQHIYSSSICKL